MHIKRLRHTISIITSTQSGAKHGRFKHVLIQNVFAVVIMPAAIGSTHSTNVKSGSIPFYTCSQPDVNRRLWIRIKCSEFIEPITDVTQMNDYHVHWTLWFLFLNEFRYGSFLWNDLNFDAEILNRTMHEYFSLFFHFVSFRFIHCLLYSNIRTHICKKVKTKWTNAKKSIITNRKQFVITFAEVEKLNVELSVK